MVHGPDTILKTVILVPCYAPIWMILISAGVELGVIMHCWLSLHRFWLHDTSLLILSDLTLKTAARDGLCGCNF